MGAELEWVRLPLCEIVMTPQAQSIWFFGSKQVSCEALQCHCIQDTIQIGAEVKPDSTEVDKQ